MEECKTVFSTYPNKRVFLTKKTNKGFWYHQGIVTQVTDKFVVLNDFKIGQVIVSFEDISSVELKGEQ